MMDPQRIKADIEAWVMEVLDAPHLALNGNSPCPFARAAWIKDRYRLVVTRKQDLHDHLLGCIDRWPADCDLWILVCDPDETPACEAAELVAVAADANRTLLPRGYIALEGHPHIPERVLDCDFNQGTLAYAVVQPLDKLARHKAILEKRGYYDNWPRDMYDAIVGVRERESEAHDRPAPPDPGSTSP